MRDAARFRVIRIGGESGADGLSLFGLPAKVGVRGPLLVANELPPDDMAIFGGRSSFGFTELSIMPDGELESFRKYTRLITIDIFSVILSGPI